MVNTQIHLIRISGGGVYHKSIDTGTSLEVIRHMKGTNYLFTGGASRSFYQFDYTSSTAPALFSALRSNSMDVALGDIRDVSLLDFQEQGFNEVAWACIGNGGLIFVDRTSLFGATTRAYQRGALSFIKVYTFMTPKKLILLGEDQYIVSRVDYSANGAVSNDYDVTPCGTANLWYPVSLAPIAGSIKAMLVCKGTSIKLVDLTDGSKTQDIAGPHTDGRFSFVLPENRLGLTYGDGGPGSVTSLWDLRTEMPCHSTCKTCDYDARSTGCTSCYSPNYLRKDGSCASACLARQYADSSRRCQDCDATCLTCSGSLPTQCSSCEQPIYKTLNAQSSCVSCSKEACPRCLQDSLCTQCLANPALNGCPQSIGYSVSLRQEDGDKKGDVRIFLMLEPQSTSLVTADLQFLVDYGFFIIEASDLALTGLAQYDSESRRLLETGRISTNKTNVLEYLVYKTPLVLITNKTLRLTVSLNNTVIKYEPAGASTKPSLMF